MRGLQQVVMAVVGTAVCLVGCGANREPAPVAPPEVTVELTPPPAATDGEQDAHAPSAAVADVDHDDACRELGKAIVPKDSQTVSVFVRADGLTCLGHRAVKDSVALTRAARAAANAGVLKAVLYVDAAVAHGRVVALMDALREAGIKKLEVAVSKRE
jgi:biopolymer transport protein ExbD